MEEGHENAKESSNSAHANGMKGIHKEYTISQTFQIVICRTLQ